MSPWFWTPTRSCGQSGAGVPLVLPQKDHDGGDVDEGQEVAGGLLVAGGHAPELLDLVPEALRQVAVLVALLVDLALLLARAQRRDDRLGAPRLDLLDQRLLVVALVGDDHLEGHPLDQRARLGNVGLLPGGQDDPDRQPQPADPGVDLGGEAAAAAAEGLLLLPACAVSPFFAPAASRWARMMVEARISHSRSGSCSASKAFPQTPFRAQRSKRLQAEFQLPKRSGRSRQGAPVLPIQRMASTKRRLSLARCPGVPALPGSRSLIRSQSSSEMAWRWRMAPSLTHDPPPLLLRPPSIVHTT